MSPMITGGPYGLRPRAPRNEGDVQPSQGDEVTHEVTELAAEDTAARRDKHLTADGVEGLSSVWAVASERDSGWGDAVVDAAVGVSAGRRRYMVGARWHRGTMVMMARQMESPALQWKCGDG